MSTLKLVQDLKDNDQDFEFYPTTQEIIDTIKADVKNKNYYQRIKKIMDIGAGDGRVLTQLIKDYDVKYFAIEKSQILINQFPENIVLLGTDFDECNLFDKEMDVIFCNPPYTKFEEWASKIISTASARYIYLVIPDRWKNSNLINNAIKYRNAKTNVLGNFDFLDADRKARAYVDVICVELSRSSSAFDLMFETEFKALADMFKDRTADEKEEKINRSQVARSSTTIEGLVDRYNEDLDLVYQNYLSISKLDYSIFRELEINLVTLKKALKERMSGLKAKYWEILFQIYEPITSRLTQKERRKVLDKMKSQASTVDFTVKNCYAMTSYVINRSSTYLDDQIVELFYDLASPENIVKYKSNEKVFVNERYRYAMSSEDRYTHFKLDYRIITSDKGGLDWNHSMGRYHLNYGGWQSYSNAMTFMQDLLVVARNLGFNANYSEVDLNNLNWDFGKRIPIYYRDLTTGKSEILVEVKFYKNRNAHLFFNPKFMLRLNVNVGRILGWVKSSQEASEELDIPVNEIEQAISVNFRLDNKPINDLLQLGYTAN